MRSVSYGGLILPWREWLRLGLPLPPVSGGDGGTEGSVGLDEPATIDKRLDSRTHTQTISALSVHREVVALGDPTTDERIADVKNADALSTDDGLVVRLTPSSLNIGDVDVLTLPALVAGTANIGDVDVLTVPAPLSTSGGGTEATSLRVTLANDSTGLVSVDDNGGSLTVDGTVAVSSLAGSVDTELPAAAALADAASAAPTTPTVGAVGLVMNATTVDRQRAVVAALDSVGTGIAAAGIVGQFDDTATAAVTENQFAPVRISTRRALLVEGVASGTAVPVSGTVTAAQATAANLLATVTQGPASTTGWETVGEVAHDAAIAGNPVTIGGSGETAADSAPSTRASADGDAVRIAVDLDGAQYVLPHGAQIWSYHENSSSALTDATVHAAPGAGLSLYVTDVICSTGAATAMNLFIEEGTTTTVLGPWYLEAVAGRGLALQFRTAKKITANTLISVTTSAAIAHSIEVLGYTAPG